MRITDPLTYLIIGSDLRYLMATREGRPIGGDEYVVSAFERVLQNSKEVGLKVSLQWFDDVAEPLVVRLRQKIAGLNDATIDAEEAKEVSRVAKRLEDVIFAELRLRRIAEPTPRRYELMKLLDETPSLLAAGVFETIPTIAQHDLRSGCRAIAFDLPTAAAFHLLRAVEACVRWMYACYFKTRDAERSWGPLVTELRQKTRAPRPDAILLHHLDHLRERFRNPTDHPEKIYEMDEAQDLLNLCLDAISRCAKDDCVRRRKASSAVATALPPDPASDAAAPR